MANTNWPRLTSAIRDGRRPAQLVHFVTPYPPWPESHTRWSFAQAQLSQCLEAEGKKDEAAKYKAQFKDAWRYADIELEPLRVAASASHGVTDQASANGR